MHRFLRLMILSCSVTATAFGQTPPVLRKPVVAPAAIAAGPRSPVTFSMELHDPRVRRVILQQRTATGRYRSIGDLRDSGKRGDRIRGDGFYTSVKQLKYQTSGLVIFRVIVLVKAPGARRLVSYSSDTFELEIADPSIPNVPAPSDPTKLVSDSQWGEVVCDEVIVEAVADISASAMLTSLQPFGTVVGRIPELHLYQLRVPVSCDRRRPTGQGGHGGLSVGRGESAQRSRQVAREKGPHVACPTSAPT